MQPKRLILPRTLLEIASAYSANDRSTPQDDTKSKRLASRILSVKRKLSKHNLSDDEAIIIAILFEKFMGREKKVYAVNVLERRYKERYEHLEGLQIIFNLVKKRLLDIRGKGRRISKSEKERYAKVNLGRLVESEVLFRESFINEILSSRGSELSVENSPYETNGEYLEDLFKYINARNDYRESIDCFLCDDDENDTISDEVTKIENILERIDQRTKTTKKRFPIQDLIEEENLTTAERDIILYLLRDELQNNDTTVEELSGIVSESRFEQIENRKYFKNSSKLVSRGIIELGVEHTFRGRTETVRLAPDIVSRLLGSETVTDYEKINQIVGGKELFNIEKPCQTMNDLILPDNLKHNFDVAIQRYEANVDQKLREWGVDRAPENGSIMDHDEAPLLILFSGSSGTGKTFAAGVMANQLKKDLLATDISRILSCWVGESEQNVKALFHTFERIVKRCENPPILFLNECDQFLTARGTASKSVDRMYNQMQNLFLEGFERMRGIMIATTNLSGSIDEAFSRRFHLKIEFPRPDLEMRVALWKKHLLPTLPLDRDLDVESLSRKYEFTGGQIAVAVRNASIEAAVRGSKVSHRDLVSACEIEAKGALNIHGGFKKAVGFGA